MRTTVDLPDDILRQVKNIAADRRTSVSKVISEFVIQGVRPRPHSEPRIYIDPETGLAQLDLGRVITMAEAREAMDEV
jgi:predicted transcriptional regulator